MERPVTRMFFPTLDPETPDARGVVAAWLVADGMHVHPGQLVAEVGVGEASGQIAAPTEGTIRCTVREGDSVPQGAVVAVID